MIAELINEFNCNHCAELDSPDQVIIYNREKEHQKIRTFLSTNITRKKSGLMYLCGHPGTGKTSSLNYVLAQMKQEGKLDFQPVMFNAMTYLDVKSFAFQLYERLHEEFLGEPPKRRLKRENVDDEDMAHIIGRLLDKISKLQEKTGVLPPHRVIVIDEVDCFQSNEKAFTLLVKHIVKNQSFATCTSVVGIANSVDLPFRKKHSAIAMRDCQLLFEPYSSEDIEAIIEEKKNSLFHKCVP